jgi:hypothetical protein
MSCVVSAPLTVIPAKAGIQFFGSLAAQKLDPGLRRDDAIKVPAGLTR